MTSRERFLAGLCGKPADRPPVAHIAAATTVGLQADTGCFMPDVHHNPERLVRLMAANHDVLGFDAVTFLINFFNEPAALGAAMDWGGPETLPAYRSHPWETAEDIEIPADFLKLPHLRTCLETLTLATRECGAAMGVMGKVMGPLSFVQVMHGVDVTLTGLLTAPGLIRTFLEASLDVIVPFANAQFGCGIDALAIGEGGAGAHMLSPELYAEFLAPVHRRLVRAIDGPAILHICGDITPRLGLLKDLGIACFNFDWAIPPARMAEAAEGAFTLMGNISTETLLNGTPADVAAQTRACVEAGVHIIGPGCAISPRCPNANLRAMTQAV